ncbi:MAG: hypothetical protein U0744_21455 [Gemmataceae bacterium]
MVPSKLRILSSLWIAAAFAAGSAFGQAPEVKAEIAIHAASLRPLTAIATFSPDGKHLITVSDDRVLTVRDLQSLDEVRSILAPANLGPPSKLRIAMARDVPILALAGEGTTGEDGSRVVESRRH